jgi:hypothetical protein
LKRCRALWQRFLANRGTSSSGRWKTRRRVGWQRFAERFGQIYRRLTERSSTYPARTGMLQS